MFNLQYASLYQEKAFIGGKWVGGSSTFSNFNPSNSEVIAQIADCGPAEAEKAILAAYKAFQSWSKVSPQERGKILRKWYDLIIQHKEDLARILTIEEGKTLVESRGEIDYAASYVLWQAGEAERIEGYLLATPMTHRGFVYKEPIGVSVAITPWNFPSSMVTRKCAPAIAAGCTIVLKPAEDTPLCALALAVLAEEAGIPEGVLNIIPSSKPADLTDILTKHPLVQKITFTGSTEIGKLLMGKAAENVKKITMELGGNAPFIVFADADLKKAVKGLVASKFRNAGQTCISANRIFIERSIFKNFQEIFIESIKNFKMGSGLESDVQLGPLINKDAFQKVSSLVDNARNKKVTMPFQGRGLELGGNFYPATVLTTEDTSLRITCEEVFGPVATLIPFDNEEEVIEKANDTPYGLASYFYTQDINRAFRIAAQLRYGMVGLNEVVLSHAYAPFGGMKESGIGRENGHDGIEGFLEKKYILVGV